MPCLMVVQSTKLNLSAHDIRTIKGIGEHHLYPCANTPYGPVQSEKDMVTEDKVYSGIGQSMLISSQIMVCGLSNVQCPQKLYLHNSRRRARKVREL